MDSRKIVFQETAVIAIGEVILSGIMVGVFAALGQFSIRVLISAIAGSIIMTLNYFFMAVTVSLAADRAQNGQVEQAKKSVQLSSVIRLICMGVALFLGIRLGGHVIALVLPLLFPRPILMLAAFFRKKVD